VNVLSEITSASTQTDPITPAVADRDGEKAAADSAKPDFAEMLNSVVSDEFPLGDTNSDAVAALAKQGSSTHWPLAVASESLSANSLKLEQDTLVDPVKPSNSKTSSQKCGHTKKSAEDSEMHKTLALAPVGQVSTIAAVVPNSGIAGNAQTDQPDSQREHSVPQARLLTTAATVPVLSTVKVESSGPLQQPAPPVSQQEPSSAQAESDFREAASVPDLSIAKDEPSNALQQPDKSSTTWKTIAEFNLPVASSNVVAGIKSGYRSGGQPALSGNDPMSSARPDAMTENVSVSSVTDEQSDDFSTPAIKEGFEMRKQELFDASGKKVRHSISGGELATLLRTSEITSAISEAQLEAVPLKSATAGLSSNGHTKPANADPFVIMDTPSADPDPRLLHSSRHEVEVGINDPTYGWVEVRTHKYAGQITATLAASSTESQRNLGTQLTGLTDYLSTREIPIHKVVMQGMNTPDSGGQQSRHSGSEGQGQRSAEEPAARNTAVRTQLEEVNELHPGQYRYSSQIHLLA